MRNIKSLSVSILALTTFWFTIGCEYKLPVVHTITDCIGYDGIPFENAATATTCCENDANGHAVIKADADEKKCRGGLFEAAHGQNTDLNAGLSMAAAGISQTAAMLGVQVDLKNGPKTLANKSKMKGADTFAAKSPTALDRPGGSGVLSGMPEIGGGGSGGGRNSGGAGNTAGGGGLGGGSGSSKGGGSAGGSEAYGKAPNAKTSGTSYGANSAEKAKRDGGDPTAVGNNLKLEGEQWGATGAKGPEAGMNAAGDEEGSANDPADYFSRIKKGDSLFAVVANRYKIKQVKMNAK